MEINNTTVSTDRASLLRLVDKDMLINILQSFTNTTGLTANIVDIDGISIFSKLDAQNNCKFCQIIWQLENKKGIHRCKGAYKRAGKQAAVFNEPYIFRCPGGLIEWAAPIIVDGKHLGSIICGQVLMWEPENFFWIELEDMNRELTNDFEPLINAAKDLKVISSDKVQSASTLLSIISNYIVKTAWEKLQHEKEIEIQHTLLNEEINTRKSLEEKLNSQSLNYHRETEKALVSKILLRDFEESYKLFKIVLANIASDKQFSTVSYIKARVFELIIVISRASVDAGVDNSVTVHLNARVMQNLNHSYTTIEIMKIALNAFENYVKEIKKCTKSKNHTIIEGIKGYIQKNYDKNPTLIEIANSVYLSAYYASRIFKESEKITIMDYLNEVKLGEAKRMLSNPRYKIDEIANVLGYKDASYFSRVFRRREGMSPSEFRISR